MLVIAKHGNGFVDPIVVAGLLTAVAGDDINEVTAAVILFRC